MKKLKIILRTCAVVKIIGSSKRPFNLDKKTIILKCLKSILKSCSKIKDKVFLEIVDDSSGEVFIQTLTKMLKNHKVPFRIHKMEFRNNGKSMEYSYKLAEKSKEEIIYFCEDDYFHLENAIPSILEAYNSKILFNSNFCIFPSDYPRLYTYLRPSLIFIGKYNHWRSITNTTATFVLTKKLFLKYKKTFYELAQFNKTFHGGEKETINKLWENNIPCISPVPSLTAHLHKSSLPFLIDWEKEIGLTKI